MQRVSSQWPSRAHLYLLRSSAAACSYSPRKCSWMLPLRVSHLDGAVSLGGVARRVFFRDTMNIADWLSSWSWWRDTLFTWTLDAMKCLVGIWVCSNQISDQCHTLRSERAYYEQFSHVRTKSRWWQCLETFVWALVRKYELMTHSIWNTQRSSRHWPLPFNLPTPCHPSLCFSKCVFPRRKRPSERKIGDYFGVDGKQEVKGDRARTASTCAIGHGSRTLHWTAFATTAPLAGNLPRALSLST